MFALILCSLTLTHAFIFNKFSIFKGFINARPNLKVNALLVEGEAMNSDSTKDNSKYIRFHGITQFLNRWNRSKDIQDDELRFGDEIEYGVFEVDPSVKSLRLSPRGAEVSTNLNFKQPY